MLISPCLSDHQHQSNLKTLLQVSTLHRNTLESRNHSSYFAFDCNWWWWPQRDRAREWLPCRVASIWQHTCKFACCRVRCSSPHCPSEGADRPDTLLPVLPWGTSIYWWNICGAIRWEYVLASKNIYSWIYSYFLDYAWDWSWCPQVTDIQPWKCITYPKGRICRVYLSRRIGSNLSFFLAYFEAFDKSSIWFMEVNANRME